LSGSSPGQVVLALLSSAIEKLMTAHLTMQMRSITASDWTNEKKSGPSYWAAQ